MRKFVYTINSYRRNEETCGCCTLISEVIPDNASEKDLFDLLEEVKKETLKTFDYEEVKQERKQES